MTPQEQQLLDGLIGRVLATRPPGKDAEAEQRLQGALANDPDALYVLAQTVLVQQYALEQAQTQLADARRQIDDMKSRPAPQPEAHTSFLGNLFGSHTSPVPPPQQPSYAPVYGSSGAPSGYGPPPGYGQQQTYAQQPGYGQPQYPPPQYVPMQSGGGFGGGFGGGGGFLQGAMQTAAGVAAGELAFRGIEDLMHGFGHEAGYGSDRMMGGGMDGDRPEVINNYYGGDNPSRGASGDSFGDRLQAADNDSGISPDLEDRRGFLGGNASDDASGSDSDSAPQFAADDNDFGSDDSSSSSDDTSDFDSGDSGSGDDSFNN